MVRVIATDLDGTLLKPIKKLSLVEKENKKFVKEFYGDVVLVSGRNAKFCAKVCNCLNIQHNFIALNGAIIVKNGKIIYKQSIKKTNLISLIDFLDTNYNDFELLIFDKYDRIFSYSPLKKRIIKKKHFTHLLKNGKLHNKIITNNKKTMKVLKSSTDILKAIIYSKNCDDMFNLIDQNFSNHFSLFPSNHSIEVSPIGVNKGNSLKYLLDTTTVKKEEVFVVGDGTNDISAFEIFENSFAISSASSHVKTKAKYTINKFSDLKEYTRLNNNFKEE